MASLLKGFFHLSLSGRYFLASFSWSRSYSTIISAVRLLYLRSRNFSSCVLRAASSSWLISTPNTGDLLEDEEIIIVGFSSWFIFSSPKDTDDLLEDEELRVAGCEEL